MTTTIAPQPEYASRSTAFSSVWEMASNRLLGELHENHQMSKAEYSQHPVMRYEQETTHTDQAPTTPRPYRTASRMRCRNDKVLQVARYHQFILYKGGLG
jgi:hypothetical protein